MGKNVWVIVFLGLFFLIPAETFFGAKPDKIRANDDFVTIQEDALTMIDVAANDINAEGWQGPRNAKIIIVDGMGPYHGMAKAVMGGVQYVPEANYSGSDAFQYVLLDEDGNKSNNAKVSIKIAEVPDYQNPDPNLREDVNNDRRVTAQDSLIVINYLEVHGSGPVPPDPIPPERPAFYWDVNGDNLISPVDVLMIINRLNRGG